MKLGTRIILRIIGIIITIVLVVPIVFLTITFPWSAMALYIYAQPCEYPEIEYAEFPFELTYEINGERFVVNDVYVCDFEGFGGNEGSMRKYRTWTGYVKSVGDEDLDFVLLKEGNTHICCNVGSPEYYMDDLGEKNNYRPEASIYYVEKPNDMGGMSSGIFPENMEFFKKYRVKIISLEISEPIENTYKYNIFRDIAPVLLVLSVAAALIFVRVLIFIKLRNEKMRRKSIQQAMKKQNETNISVESK